MTGNQSTMGRCPTVPFVIAVFLLIILAGCGADKQDEVFFTIREDSFTDRDMVPAPEASEAFVDTLDPVAMVVAPKPAEDAAQLGKTPIDGALVLSSVGHYSLLAGSFVKQENATSRVENIQNLGFQPVQEVATVAGDTFYRVHLRGIESYDEADSLGFILNEKLGLDYLVLKR